MPAEVGLVTRAVVLRAVAANTSAAAMKAISTGMTALTEAGIITADRAFHLVSTEPRITEMGLAMLMAPDRAAIRINGATGFPLLDVPWALTDIRVPVLVVPLGYPEVGAKSSYSRRRAAR
jgi:hypothetical protein